MYLVDKRISFDPVDLLSVHPATYLFKVAIDRGPSVKIRYFRDPPLVTDKLSNNIVQKFI